LSIGSLDEGAILDEERNGGREGEEGGEGRSGEGPKEVELVPVSEEGDGSRLRWKRYESDKQRDP